MEQTLSYKGHDISIVQDTTPQNPIQEFDGNAKYALFHKKYEVQNDTDLNHHDYQSWDEFKKALIIKYKPIAILPVYMYDHGGQTIRTEPFSCSFDSGQLGFVFVDKETLKEWGYDSRKAYETSAGRTLEEDLKSNVSLYDDYLQGNVWGFEIENSASEDSVDSCWGFYGDSGKEEALTQAKQIVDNLVGKTIRVYAEVTTRCYVDVVADTYEEAFTKAEEIDGGDFISEEHTGDFKIYQATKLANVFSE